MSDTLPIAPDATAASPAETPEPPVVANRTAELYAPLKEPLRLALFALGMGAAFDVLFHGGTVALGINVFLFAILLLATLYFLAKREQRPSNKRTVAFLVTPLLFFAAMLAVRASDSLAFFNVVACVALVLYLFRLWNRDLFSLTVGELLAAPWKALGGTLATAPDVSRKAVAQIVVEGERKSRYLAVLRGMLFALPAIVAFTWLFSSADARFGKAVGEMLTWLFPADFAAQVLRFGWAIVAAFCCAGGIGYALSRSTADRVYALIPPRPKPLGSTEAGIVLGSVTALFAAFLVMQATYLFGGNAHVRAVPDLTYAEYARHGFAELNIVAVLTLLLVTLLKATTRRETMPQERGFAVLSTTLLALTLPLLVSSFVRMQAYEAAYGASELRLYVDLFIGWLAVGLIWCAAMLWRMGISSGLGVYACAIGFLLSLNIVNPDAAIARRNIERYRQGRQIDTDYLATLSEDAIPELESISKDNRQGAEIKHCKNIILERKGDHTDWSAWNLSRFRAEQNALQMRLNDSE